MRIIWGALLASNAMLAYVAKVVPPQQHPTHGHAPPPPPEPTMLYALGGMAVVVAVLSFVLPARFRAQGFRRQPSHRIGQPIEPALLKRRLALAATPFILSLALSHAVSLFGLVLAMVGHPFPIALGFILVGSALIAVRFPTMKMIES